VRYGRCRTGLSPAWKARTVNGHPPIPGCQQNDDGAWPAN
jgi:hypothetical protein